VVVKAAGNRKLSSLNIDLRDGIGVHPKGDYATANLSGKTALVTGASRGVGQAIEQVLAAVGAQVRAPDGAHVLAKRWITGDIVRVTR
jgi:NADPH:quinone reductase-like Zn-dependent oxidoreductase